MHYYALVVIPDDTEDVKEAVTELLAPHSENVNDDGWWDWWVIGGRWQGQLDGYDPRGNPDNYSVCRLCDGTGVRRDSIATDSKTDLIEIVEPRFPKTHQRYGQTGWCNGCDGRGLEVNFSYTPHDGDIGTKGQVTEPPYTLVTAAGVIHKENWDGKDWVDNAEAMNVAWSALDPATRVVVVDYHS